MKVVGLATATAVLVLSSSGFRAQAAARVAIDWVEPDVAQERLFIHGRNFGKEKPTVLLDDMELEVLSFADDVIEATLPAVQGSLRLSVEKTGPPFARILRIDSMDVTVGVVGPAGPLPRAPRALAGKTGPVGLQGPPGEPAMLVDGSVTTNIIADKAVTTDKLADDFTIDVSRIIGVLGDGFENQLPDVIDNRVTLEVSVGPGFVGDVIVTSGPGLEIERVPGFDAMGRPKESPGPSAEFPLIFEYEGPGEQNLEDIRSNGNPTSVEIIVKTLGGAEVFRWQFFDYLLTTIEPAQDGRKRYILEQLMFPPDNNVRIGREPIPFPAEDSRNPATDTKVDIAGNYVYGHFPVVELDEANRTLTMTFDHIEGGTIWNWVVDTAEGRGNNVSLSIIELDGDVEIGRTNYFECFPIRYDQFTGFGQAEKIKEKVVIAYGFSMPAP
jgi:hypothetical protein